MENSVRDRLLFDDQMVFDKRLSRDTWQYGATTTAPPACKPNRAVTLAFSE